MIKKYLHYIVLIFSLQTFSQGEANIWYFGRNAGLDFNTNPPTPLNNLDVGTLFSSEGCSTISDSNGNLLFLTNGEKVWNRNFQLMPNGDNLAGHNSSSQSSAIIPFPGSYNFTENRFDKYFLVTLDDYVEHVDNDKGVRFSEINMTLDNGLGDVTENKNIHLFGTTTTEKVCVVPHSNGCDYWVILKVVDSNEFYTYHISTAGFDTNPVISTTSFFVDARPGQMKASPNNKLISYAQSAGDYNGFYIFNFDNSTGLITDKFADINGIDGQYGTEFSPNSKLVYKSIGSRIYQYNLEVSTNADFVSSKNILNSTVSGLLSMQLAPDGKIYIARPVLNLSTNGIGVINNPNELGIDCNFNPTQQSLNGASCLAGLPNQLNNLKPYNEIIIEDENCSYIQLALINNLSITDYHWEVSTVDNPEIVIETSNEENPTFTNLNPNETYTVKCTVVSNCYTNTFQLTYNPDVNDSTTPSFSGLQSNFCQNQTPNNLPLISNEGISGTWFPTSISTSTVGTFTYIFTPNSGECALPFAFEITINPTTNLSFTNISICRGENVTFPDTNGVIGTWLPSTISNTNSATYTFTPVNQCINPSQWQVEVKNLQQILFSDTIICSGQTLNFPNTNGIIGTWSPSVVNSNQDGIYTFTPSENCSQYSTWKVIVTPISSNLTLTIINNIIIANIENANQSLLYQLDNGIFQYSNVFNNVKSGCHTINVTDTLGCTQLSSTAFVFNYPKFFTPNDDGHNDYWNIKLENSNAKLYVFDRYGKLITQIFQNELGWNGTYNGNQLPATDYWFVLEYDQCGIQKTFKSHFSLIR
jgi:gliding motility-associated-like protein